MLDGVCFLGNVSKGVERTEAALPAESSPFMVLGELFSG